MKKIYTCLLWVFYYTRNNFVPAYLIFSRPIIVAFFILAGFCARAQVDGDFQTKNATGAWSDYLSWNTRNGGAWTVALAGQIPVATSNVFIESGNTINVDIPTAVCKDLNFTSPGITLRVILIAGNTLTIYGNLIQMATGNIPFPSFGAGAKIVFAGSSNQTLIGSNIATNLNNVEINKTAGTFTLPGANTSFTTFTLTAGNLDGATTAVLTGIPTSAININGGTWTQIAGANAINGGPGINIPLTISGGIMTLATASSTGFHFSDVTISNSGVLNLDNATSNINISNSLDIDATATLNTGLSNLTPPALMNFLGTVNYTAMASQDILNTNYANLGLSGTGDKTPLANLVITGNIIIAGTAVLTLSNLTVTIGGNWANYGTAGLLENSSVIDFNGIGSQSINTTGGEDFFILKKSGPGTLTLNSDARFANTSSGLDISSGIFDAGTNTVSGTMSTTLSMSGGILKLEKLNTTLPEFTTLILTGPSTIELSGGAGTQTLQGGRIYRNLSFSNDGVKKVSSAPTSITGTITISDAATLDVSNNTMGGAGTSLTMTGNSIYRTEGTGTKPDAQGAYLLGTGTTIDFANISATQQDIRLGTTYYNIDISGINVSNASLVTPVTLQAGGIFTVKTGGRFYLANTDGFAGGANTAINIVNNPGIVLENNCTVGYSSLLNQAISNTIPYENLLISGTGIKSAPASTLIIRGNLVKTGTGTFNANGGTVLLNGGTQSFAGLSYNNLLLDNAGTKTLSGNAIIIDSVTIGNLLMNPATTLELGNNYLTLRSTASKTARLGTVASAANVNYGGTGRFVIERNFTPRRAWRLVTAPITNDGNRSVYSSWQMGGAITNGSGTYITGVSAPAGGLDVSPLNNYSLKTFDGAKLNGVDNTVDLPLSGNNGIAGTPDNYGMFLFVRGDRSTNTLFYPPNANETTLRDTGKVQVKTQVFTLAGAVDGFCLVGNPYASQVDLNQVMASGIGINNTTLYMYDPYINTYQGGYLTYTADVDGVFTATPPSPGGQTSELNSSQAFYVQKKNDPAVLTFNESNKSGSAIPALFRPLNTSQSIRVNLFLLNDDNSTVLADGIKAQFDQRYSNPENVVNALKFTNINENLGLLRNNKLLAIENRIPIIKDDTLFLNLTRTTSRKYRLVFEGTNLDPGLTAYLDDRYLGKKTLLDLLSSSNYNFSVNDTAASHASDRFRIIFKPIQDNPLPVIYSNINAIRQGSSILVKWTVENEINLIYYELLKSIDGTKFDKINTTITIDANQHGMSYSSIDQKPVSGNNYYRIRSVDHDGNTEYSRIVTIKTGIAAGISIYPNPIKDGKISLQFNNAMAGKYLLRLTDNPGRVLFSRTINIAGGSMIQEIVSHAIIAKGIYQLEIIHPDKSRATLKIIN